MSLVRFRGVGKQYESGLVFHEADLRLEQGDRVGLIGKNGTGKTTLLRLIAGQEQPSEGQVELQEGLRIGTFSQFSELDGEIAIEEELDKLFAHVHQLEEALLEVEIAIEDLAGDDSASRRLDALVRRQATLLEQMGRIGGWAYKVRIDTVLSKLGFRKEHRTCPIDQLSGGWRNRAALAKILLQSPELLLLDEPTNYLDINGLDWLETWLQDFQGAAMVVSHDRDFLEHVVTRMVEIENYHLQFYEGGFERYVHQKRRLAKSLERQFSHEEELLALEAAAITDRREALRDLGRSLKRKLADIKKRVEPKPVERIVTGIYDGLKVPNLLCGVDRLSKAYGEDVLFADLSFEVHRLDRFAILGPNGCGKTTLLRVLMGVEAPDEGQVVWPRNSDAIDFNQTVAELDPDDTLSHAVNLVGLAYVAQRRKVNRFLELLRFSEMDLKQRIGTLSGGQRARVALAQCLLSGAPVLILDEPTNHLDLTTTQVMESALVHFPGAVLVVSHDRFFVDKVANRLLVFEGQSGAVREVSGNWSLYQASLETEAD